MSKDHENNDKLSPPASRAVQDDYDNLINNLDGMGKNAVSIAKSLLNITSSKLDDIHSKSKDLINDLHPYDYEETAAKRTEYMRDNFYFQRSASSSNSNGSDGLNGSDNFNGSNCSNSFNGYASNGTGPVDQYFPSPYQSRDPTTIANEQAQSNQNKNKNAVLFENNDDFNWFGRGPFGGRRGGNTPFGLKSKKPDAYIYKECMQKDGLSVWDSDGYWRCLFPNSQVASRFLKAKSTWFPNAVLTKDDFFAAVKEAEAAAGTEAAPLDNSAKLDAENSGIFNLGSKGVFFKELSDYLGWRSHNLPTRRRDCWGNRWSWENGSSLSKAPSSAPVVELKPSSDDALADTKTTSFDQVNSNNSEKNMVSYSVLSTMSSDSLADEVTMKETRYEYFSDGSVSTKVTTKTKPYGAQEWADVKETVETLPLLNTDASEYADSGSGWFWK